MPKYAAFVVLFTLLNVSGQLGRCAQESKSCHKGQNSQRKTGDHISAISRCCTGGVCIVEPNR